MQRVHWKRLQSSVGCLHKSCCELYTVLEWLRTRKGWCCVWAVFAWIVDRHLASFTVIIFGMVLEYYWKWEEQNAEISANGCIRGVLKIWEKQAPKTFKQQADSLGRVLLIIEPSSIVDHNRMHIISKGLVPAVSVFVRRPYLLLAMFYVSAISQVGHIWPLWSNRVSRVRYRSHSV